MDRRKAITTAAAASLTLLAGAAGIAFNSGLVGASADDNVGQVNPVSGTGTPITVYVDDPAATTSTPAPPVTATTAPPATTSTASTYAGDDDREGEEDESHDDDRGTYEGHEDDD